MAGLRIQTQLSLILRLTAAFISFVFFIFGCTGDKFEATTEGRLNVFLTGLSLDYASQMREMNLQEFRFLTGQKNRLESAWAEFSEFIFSKHQRDTVSGWYSNLSTIKDRYLKRQIELLSKLYLANTIEFQKSIFERKYRLLDKLVSARFQYNGKSVNASELLISAENTEKEKKREAAEAISKKFAPMKDEFIALIRERSDAARRAGFNDFPSLLMFAEDISPEMLDSILVKIESATAPIYKKYLAERYNPEQYDYLDLPALFDTERKAGKQTQSLENLQNAAGSAFAKIGIAPYGKIEASLSSPAAGAHGFTVAIPSDYRIALNRHTTGIQFKSDYIFHYSLGEYYTHLHDKKTILAGFSGVIGASSRINQNMTGRLLVLILQKTYGQDPAFIFRSDGAFEIFNLRKNLMMADFEWTLYTDPTLNPDTLFRQMAEKYLMVTMPEEYGFSWITDYFIIREPFHYAMDIAGEAGAHQLFASLSQTLKPLEQDPNAYAKWLEAYIFRYGELYPWYKKIADITGSSLKTDYMLRYFTSGQ
jgi:hypothetical protein